MSLKTYKCTRCNWVWASRKLVAPGTCANPKCRSPYWDRPRKKRGEINKKHGMAKTKIYGAWVSMRSRCNNPKDQYYAAYGGRGVKVCDRWNDFANFYQDVGNRPDGRTLDRYPNNDGNYEPSNCRWATKKEQRDNQRVPKTTKLFIYQGESLPLIQWTKRLGINHSSIQWRLRSGWTIERAFTTPISRSGTLMGNTNAKRKLHLDRTI